jgi:hypothetical protein
MSDWKLEVSRELTLAHKLCTYTQYWVIKRSEEETVRLLVKMGGGALAHDARGDGPFYYAASERHVETATRDEAAACFG